MKIKATTLGEAADLCREALLAHESGINEGFLKSGEKDFKVGLSIEIEVGAISGDFNVGVDISYTKEKIKESYSRKIRQTPLFDEVMITCPVKAKMLAEKACDKCTLRCAINMSEPNKKGERLEQSISCAAWADRDHEAWMEAFLQDCDMWLEDNGHSHIGWDMPWVTPGWLTPEDFIPPTCRVCGCTDDNACEGGCTWVKNQPDLCSACARDMETYRLQNKYNGNWWEGPAESVEKACQLAGGGTETDYHIKVKTKGGWSKPKRRAA